MDFVTALAILDTTVRLATPLLFACLAGLVSERAGVFDIGLEGKLLASAFFSAAFAAISGSVWVGLLAGVTASMVLAGILARFSLFMAPSRSCKFGSSLAIRARSSISCSATPSFSSLDRVNSDMGKTWST